MGVRRSCEVKSLNDTDYRIDIWDISYSGTIREFNIEDGTLQVSYDASGDAKLTEIICSSIEFVYMVEDSGSQAFINYLRSASIEEKDVYISLYNENQCQFSGYLLLDLGDETDEYYPYPVTMKAVDGLSLLKEINFVPNPETNFAPYSIDDTYINNYNLPGNNRYQTFTRWITLLLDNADFGDATQGLPDYKISTSVNWYNEEHGNLFGTLNDYDPLDVTACNGEQFYKEQSATDAGLIFYEPMNCYEALESICRAWGMRCVMYNQTIHFIQIGEYQKDETGTTASPDNINTFIYDSSGSWLQTNDFLGNNSNARYFLEIENSTGNELGLVKLAGTTWGSYPPIKKVSTNFPSISNFNAFQNFPLITGHTDTPHTWPAQGIGSWAFTYSSLGTINDAATLDGFYMMLSLKFYNSSLSPVDFLAAWSVQAKPSSASTWNTATGLSASFSQDSSGNTQLYWEPLREESAYSTNYKFTNSGTSTLGGYCNSQLFCHVYTLAPGDSVIDMIAQTDVAQNNNVMPPHPSMTGDWDFRFVTASWGGASGMNYGGVQSHGAIEKIPGTTPIWAPPWANINGNLTLYPNFGPTLNVFYNNVSPSLNLCMFSPVSGGSIGASSYNTQYYTNTTDSYILEIDDTLWGDTSTNDVPGSLKVYNGTAWVYTDYLGKWGVGVSTGLNSFTEVLCSEALNIQNTPTAKGNYVLALSKTNKNLDSNVLYPKYVNPLGIIKDSLNNNHYVPSKIKMNMSKDEVSGMWFEFKYNQITGTSTTLPSDWGGGPVDDDGGGFQMMVSNNTNSTLASLKQSNTNSVILSASADFYQVGGVAFSSMQVDSTGNSGDYQLKTGDVLILNCRNLEYPITLTADFNSTDTSISFSSITIETNVDSKTKVYVSQSDEYNQTQRKTRGTIAGFDIDVDGIEKDGIEIIGWTDSDTMEGSDLANKVPTTESVKAYVDSQSAPVSKYTLVSTRNTVTTDSNTGENYAVIVKFDYEDVSSSSNPFGFTGPSGETGLTNSTYAFYTTETGDYEFSWNIATDTAIINNRILVGVKLQMGEIDVADVVWTDYDPTHSYIYDRGNGAVRKGSTFGQTIVSVPSVSARTYWRIVIWKQGSSNGTMRAVTELDGCNLILKKL